MPTTSNFGWTTPADTDLVKDGAAAIRTLGNGIDTSFVDLKGGTTNQILAKNSDSDLDFKWVADAAGIPATIFDAKGDLIAATAADTAARLGVGANGTVLTADSAEATGLKWATPAGGATWTLLNSGGTAFGGANITISSITNNDLMIVIAGFSDGTGQPQGIVRVNGSSSSIYANWGGRYFSDSSYSPNNVQGGFGVGTEILLLRGAANAASTGDAYLFISGCKSTTSHKVWWGAGGMDRGGSSSQNELTAMGGWIATNSAITSLNINSRFGTPDSGTVYVYGAN